jgi:hypothetical protein
MEEEDKTSETKVSKREAKRPKPDVSVAESGETAAATGSDVTVSADQLAKFQAALFSVFEEQHAQQVIT